MSVNERILQPNSETLCGVRISPGSRDEHLARLALSLKRIADAEHRSKQEILENPTAIGTQQTTGEQND